MTSTDMEELHGSDHILRLPSAPVYMSIIKTMDGKPQGTLIWASFVHREALSLLNENVSSTLISLSKNIGDLTEARDTTGKVVKLTLEGRSYNIFLPHPQSQFQFAFVVVFEERNTILVEDKHREELVRLMVEKMTRLGIFIEYIRDQPLPITPDNPLYTMVQDDIASVIDKWDSKRVKYLKKKVEEERKRLAKLAKKEMENARKERERRDKEMRKNDK